MNGPKNILVFQTAFLGDVILTLPMIQALKRAIPKAMIDVVTTPAASPLLVHPDISAVIPYDKRKTQRGFGGMLSLARQLRSRRYDIAIVPHRSFRSALVVALSGIPIRIGFSSAAGKFLYTHIVQYEKHRHEIERNVHLLSALDIPVTAKELPSLYPDESAVRTVRKFLFEREIPDDRTLIAVAPGSVWNTKRWLAERYAELSRMLAERGCEVVIIGGREDAELGRAIVEAGKHKQIHDATGKLTLPESAALIGRCSVLVTNDSAPLHLGVAMRTPVVAIFGATIPEFGFAPYGERDVVIETPGLHCRPCGIHGGKTCPTGTFDCMKRIETQMVYDAVVQLL
ncbi:MAG: lipopolysaccharide heptosyltransferase II [Bacteroidota bacterium]